MLIALTKPQRQCKHSEKPFQKTQFGNRKFKIPRKCRTRFSAMKMESISTWETPPDIWKNPKRVDLIAVKLNKKYFFNRNRFPLCDARARSASLPADLSLVVLLSAVHDPSCSLSDTLFLSLSLSLSSSVPTQSARRSFSWATRIAFWSPLSWSEPLERVAAQWIQFGTRA